jgi:predicted DCC family thiol-disulfide oxidoreductase YuxK
MAEGRPAGLVARVSPFTAPEGPEMRPAAGAALVALFDGQCGVCTRSAAWVAERDTAGRVERLDLRDPVAAARFPSLDPASVRAALHVVDAAGRLSVGIDALARLLALLPGWRLTARVMVMPGIRVATDRAYRFFASRRLWFNRFFPLAEQGCDETCTHGASPAPGRAPAPKFVDGRGFLGPPR